MIPGVVTAVACILLQSAASLFLSGALCPEDMDEQTVEKFEHLAAHPVCLNYAGRGKLEECGLFSAFQIVSLLDYRKRSGDILSFSELSRLDGWSGEFVDALREYIDLSGSTVPGQSSSRKSFQGDFTLRYGSSSYLAKTGMEWNDRWSLFVSSKKALPLNVSAVYYGKGALSKLAIGNYNARFAQGLALWSGMTMSGLPTVESLSRRESGISASRSTSAACNGIAAEFNFGRLTLSAGTTLELEKETLKIGALANLSYLWTRGQCGITAVAGASAQTVSANWKFRLGKADFYGEAAWEFATGAPAIITGIRMDPRWKVAWGLTARYYSPSFEGHWSGAPGSFSRNTDETGIAAVFRYQWVNLSADTAWRPQKGLWQTKAILNLNPEISVGRLTVSPLLKYTFCRKAGNLSESSKGAAIKNNLRSEVKATLGPWQAGFRGDCLWCRGFAWLALAETGYKDETLSCFLHAEYFDIPNWDDRIYVYQRDVPGSFNVTARYGKGLSASLVGGCALHGKGKQTCHRINFRAGALIYRKETQKPSAFEWRVQYSFKW